MRRLRGRRAVIVHIVCKGRELAQRLGESLVHKQLDDLVSWTHPEAKVDRAIEYVPTDHGRDCRPDYEQQQEDK